MRQEGNAEAAAGAFRAGLKGERGHAGLAVALADLLQETSGPKEAETVLRTALAYNRRSTVITVRLAQVLSATGRAAEAVRLMAKLAAEADPDHTVLAQHAASLKAAGQPAEAIAVYERAARLFPDSPVAHHNLAAANGDLGRHEAAARSAATALKRGGNAPQTWLVYARALLDQRRLDEAEQAFRQAIAREPTYLDAHRDLAQLIWMRTEDPRAATALLDAHITQRPDVAGLFALRANILNHAGDRANAYATLQQAIRRHPDEAGLHLAAAELAGHSDQPQVAVAHAERAVSLSPGGEAAQTALFAACVAAGNAERANAVAQGLVQRSPLDQRALAYQATAWRLLGDPRYAELYDYAAFVRAWQMDVPDGWATLDAYLADLTEALGGVHAFRTHPLDQSLRHGSQASNLLTSEQPVIKAFFKAVDGPIRRHLAEIGRGRDALRSRNAGGHRFRGAWSVKLRPGGFHVDHVHPEGWLSSACYIAVPQTDAESREAWIKFGEPGIPTRPALGPEHFVKPEPGMLVLFPSYMWHGTVPFAAGQSRLSVAFDLLPAARS